MTRLDRPAASTAAREKLGRAVGSGQKPNAHKAMPQLTQLTQSSAGKGSVRPEKLGGGYTGSGLQLGHEAVRAVRAGYVSSVRDAAPARRRAPASWTDPLPHPRRRKQRQNNMGYCGPCLLPGRRRWCMYCTACKQSSAGASWGVAGGRGQAGHPRAQPCARARAVDAYSPVRCPPCSCSILPACCSLSPSLASRGDVENLRR
jgi:hypothetical protein